MASWGGGASSVNYLFGGEGADAAAAGKPAVLQDISQENFSNVAQAAPATGIANIKETLAEPRLKAMMLNELRTLCRELNLSPAGSKETLIERLRDFASSGQAGWAPTSACGIASGAPAAAVAPVQEAPGFPQANNEGTRANAYARPDGQNVGNFITDRSSSRVLAPPGGGSQITFG